ncbi:MAG: glucose-6-phosphate isomerase family protein [Anaerolineae bacterium]|nr:glucose-6-phosphate isomerase family protein [Anaerolineae bacterium]
MEPFTCEVEFRTGVLRPRYQILQRTLREIGSIFANQQAVREILSAEGDRLIYEVYVAAVPEDEGHLPYSTTIIYPGQVGDEYHITKGHYHRKRDRAEVYLGLSGHGCLLLQNEQGEVRMVEMKAGIVAYVPPGWAHRTANTGDVPFVFFAVYPGDAGHDYETIEATGFAKILVALDGQPVLIDNPRWRR